MAVNLQKGQKISLDKEAGTGLSKVVMGLGWDVAKKKGFMGFGGGSVDIDLDTSCLMFDEQGQVVERILAAQFKAGRDKGARRSFTHLPAGRDRSGEGNVIDQRHQRGTGCAITFNQRQNIGQFGDVGQSRHEWPRQR